MSRRSAARSVALVVLLSLPSFTMPALAVAESAPDDRTLSPYFVVRSDDPDTDRMPLVATTVRVDVAGSIAGVVVTQTYRSDGPRPIHATYVFPASTRAAVHGLTMTTGGERVVATIRERAEARRTFDAAKKAGKNAALLEQQRPNVFSMHLANIMPGQEVEVELRYSELLVPEDGTYTFAFPNVVGPRYSEVRAEGAPDTEHWLRSPFTRKGVPPAAPLRLTGTLRAGMPIEALDAPSHPIRAEWPDSGTVHFALTDEAAASGADRDFVLRYRLEGGRIQTGLLLHEGEDENFFSLMLQPPARVAIDEIPPREYVFVVDVSGSMRGFPLETAKTLLRDLVSRLRPTDTFNIVFFESGSRRLAPRSLPATRLHADLALQMLDRQQGGGGTRLLAAIQDAMAIPMEPGRSRSLIVVTDGYIAAEREVFEFIRANLGHANVFAFGIGSSVNRYLIEGIAKAGLGEPFVVPGPEGAAAEAARFRRYVETPVLTDLRVAFEGFDAYDLEPAALPDLLADRPILFQGKWRGRPEGRIRVTGQGGRGAYAQDVIVGASVHSPGNAPLRQLWARARIAAISDFAFTGETPEDREALVALGLRYSLLTRHTSFVAVREKVVNAGGDGRNVTQALPLPRGVEESAIGAMAMGDEPGWLWLLAAMLGAAGLVWAAARRRAA